MSKSRRRLKKHNRKVLATRVKPALTDRAVRALAPMLAGKKTVTGIENTLRQDRRVRADYNRAHVHVGTDPHDDFAVAQALPEKEPDPLSKLTAEQKQRIAVARSSAPLAARAAPVKKERVTEKTFKAWGEEGTTLSATESAAQPGVNPLSRGLERQAQAAAAAATRRDREREKLAWDAFEKASVPLPNSGPVPAQEIAKVWPRSLADRDTGAEAGREILTDGRAFALAVASFVKKAARTEAERARRREMLAECWRLWRVYSAQWKRSNPDARLPNIPSERAEPVYTPALRPIPEAVAIALRHEPPVPRAIVRRAASRRVLPSPLGIVAPDDPIVTKWMLDGMPLPGLLLFRLSTLEEVIARAAIPEWDDPPAQLRSRSLQNQARSDWWKRFHRFKPRSLMDV